MTQFKRKDYSVGWICAIPIEVEAATATLDRCHPLLKNAQGDSNVYKYGEIHGHNVVITWLPEGRYGGNAAANVAAQMMSSFGNLRFGLMVGVGGGAPSPQYDIRLGDIVVSQPTAECNGVIQYDFGKATEDGFLRTNFLNAPPSILLKAVAGMRALNEQRLIDEISNTVDKIRNTDTKFASPGAIFDELFEADYKHISDGCGANNAETSECKNCDLSKTVPRPRRSSSQPCIHYGIIASGNQVIKKGTKREKLRKQLNVLCFEMEAAALMNDFPCLVIRGICDYCDSHKNKRWQPYAAGTAAAYAKALLSQIAPVELESKESETSLERNYMVDGINIKIPFNMTMRRNKNFLGRNEELQYIHQSFRESSLADPTIPSRLALISTGGMGKTQIALEYAYRYNQEFTSVFWISAATLDTIHSSFMGIIQSIAEEQVRVSRPESRPDYNLMATKLGIPGAIDAHGRVNIAETGNKSIEDIRKALFHWFQLHENRFLLIFDNADDLESFDIEEYLPRHGNGAILITSCRDDFIDSSEGMTLEGLSKDNAVELLLRLAHLISKKEDYVEHAIQIVERLGFMPLAISHAGCFIRQTKLPLHEYLSHYERNFMKVQAVVPKTGWHYQKTAVATTWDLSFQQIKEEDEKAASLLLVSSYLNPQEIHAKLWEDGEEDPDNIHQRVRLLASYSLIKTIRHGVFTVHPVVHTWAREHLDKSQRVIIIYQALSLLWIHDMHIQERLPDRKSQYWAEQWSTSNLKYLSLHLKQPLQLFIDAAEMSSRKTFAGLMHLSNALSLGGRSQEALEVLERAQVLQEKHLGANHEETIASTQLLGSVLQKLGKYDEALVAFTRSRAIISTLLGDKDLDSLDMLEDIAYTLEGQGDHDRALEHLTQVWCGRKDILGEKALPTLDVRVKIADIMGTQGRREECLTTTREILGHLEAVSDDFYDKKLNITFRAAILLTTNHASDEGVRVIQGILDRGRVIYGENDSKILAIIKNMAAFYLFRGDLEASRKLFEQALAGDRATVGEKSDWTIATLINLSLVLHKQEDYFESQNLLKHALEASKEFFGAEHPDTIDIMNRLDELNRKIDALTPCEGDDISGQDQISNN